MDSQTYFTPCSRRDGFLCNGHSVRFPRISCAPIKLPSPSPRSSVYTRRIFFSRGACPHFNARRCAHGLCVNRAQADPSLMRRERLNRHPICSSPVRLQRVRVYARDTRLNGESRGESDLYSNTSPPFPSLAQDSGNSVRCSECRLMLYSKLYSVGKAYQSLYK